jgi:FkbM family methyltransferase
VKAIQKLAPVEFKPEIVVRDGKRWFISDLANVAEYHLYYGFQYDTEAVSLVREVLRPGDVAVDVGANVGIFAATFADLVGLSGGVVALEPSPIHFGTLSRNMRLQDRQNVVIVNIAAAASDGSSIHYTTRSSGSLVSSYEHVGMECLAVTEVRTRPLDEIMTNAGRLSGRPVRLVKIDVDGNEIDVLRGARETLARSRPYILLEVSERAQTLAGASAMQLLEYVASCGYDFRLGTRTVADLSEAAAFCADTPDVFRDLLCVPRAIG